MLTRPVTYREKRVVLTTPLRTIDLASTVSPQRMRRWKNPRAAMPCAVVMHDSFMRNLAPYLNEHWQHIWYAAGHDIPIELIERERPIVVIHEIVERQLMDHQLRNPAKFE